MRRGSHAPPATTLAQGGNRASVTVENSGTLHVGDTAAHEVPHTIDLSGLGDLVRRMGVVVSSDGTRVYVTTGRGRTVVTIDAATWQPLSTVEVGERPWASASPPTAAISTTANGPSNDVSVVDTETNQVVGAIPAGERPWGVAIIAE